MKESASDQKEVKVDERKQNQPCPGRYQLVADAPKVSPSCRMETMALE
jgi:hypothetical protein